MKINKTLLLLKALLILTLSVSTINAQEIDNSNGDLNISDDSINVKNDEIISLSMTNDDIYADSVDPMYMMENGTVSGSADIIAVNPWTTSGSLQYTIPDDVKEIKSAIVIVNSYSGSGNADNYALHSDVTLTTDSTKTLGSEDLTYSGNQATDPVVYVINDHTTKQYSDYQCTYDILSDISSLTPGSTITVNVANSKYGTKGFDGRIKLIGLFIAYDDDDLDEVTYWLDIGQQWTSSSDAITINTASYVGEPDNVTFKSVALSSNLGGNYKFYGEPANDPEYISGNYYKYLTWDLSDIFRPGVNLGYSYDASKEGWGSYKTNLILVTATEEFKYKEIYVSPNGNNDDYGIDWNSAKKDIEVALSLIEDGGTIYVDEGTTFTTSGTSGISIAKNVNIVGKNNNVIIDANNTGIIFNIGAYNVNLTNLTLINGNATNFASKKGAAIFADGTTLNINNCSFINNTAGPSSSYGGAINLKSTSTTIVNSIFEENTAFYAGGAINAEDTNILLDISNSTFTKNGVTNTGWAYGGAICSYGTVNINQCIFYNNTLAEGKNGRSINQYDGALTITNSILLDGSNSVYFKTVTSGSVENSWWGNNESNKAVSPKDLGYTNDDVESYLILNLTKDSNDFIVGDSALITVDLTKNQNGVESVTSLPSLPVTINKSTKVTLENGKATASVVVSELGENVITAEVYGKNASITVNGVAKLDVVYVNGTGGDDSNGLNANTWAGAVKSIDRALILVANGGTIYVADGVTYKKVADDSPIKIEMDVSIIGQSMENTIISGNNINRLFNIVSGNVYFENLTIANAVRDTTGNTASAAIVSTGNLNLKNVILANNTCGAAGAAIYATGGSLNVSDCIFINNTIARSISRNYGGGAIYSNKIPLSVKNTVFKDNSAFTGGAIFGAYSAMTIDNCSFYNNRAPGSYSGGGAILIMQTGTSYINNCTFVNNSANSGGGISVTNGHILKLNSSVFADNSATSNDGGAAAYFVTGSSVTNCIFLNNTDAKNGRTISCSNNAASFEDNWWSQNESNKDKNPRGTYGNFVRNVNSYIILNTNVSSTELLVGDSATITLDLTKNQNDVEAGIMPELPVSINSINGDVNVTDAYIVNGKLTISYTATSSGEGSVTVESYGTVISHVTFDNVMPLPDVVINSATTPWSDGIFAGVGNNLTVTLNNKESVPVDNIVVELYSNESDELIASYTIDSLAAGSSKVIINDPSVRPITADTVYGAYNNNIVRYTVNVTYNGKVLDSKSYNKKLAYDGYFNKTYAYGGHDNVIARNYTISGDIVIASQPLSKYADQFTRQRTETWDIAIPDDSTLVKAFLYFNYNWDTSFFPDGWNLTFNEIEITNDYISWDTDQGNLGYYGSYGYGIVVFDVSDYFVNGENTFNITKTGNCALYPSTLVLLYNSTDSKTIKDVYFTDICDVLYNYYNPGYTNLTNVYAPYNNIDITNLQEAHWYVFAGSASGSGDGDLLFNGKRFNGMWSSYSSDNTCFAYDADVSDVIGKNNDAWYLTDLSRMSTVVVYEQILVVTRNVDLPTAETTVKSEYTSVPTVYAGVNNTITVTVKNTGASAKDVVVTLKIGDDVIGTQTLTDYESGETYTLTFVDTTIRHVTENTVIDNNNKYMNYTVVVENSDGVLINETNSSFVILYNGNLGKDYEYPNANPLLREYTITGDVIVANGSQYAGSSDNVNDVINVAFEGDVAEALLYISYNWNNPSLGDFTSWNITFNNKVIAPIASYKDQGNLGRYGSYDYGLVVYNVTGFVVNGENALSINRTPKNVAIYPASLLVLTNDEDSFVEKTVYILEEVDLLSKTNNKNLPAGFISTFDVVDGNATLYVFAAGAQAGEGNLIVNDETYTDVWKGTDKSVEVFTTDVDAGNIKVYFESTGGTILALHQMIVVSNEHLPEIDVSALKTPWNDGIYAFVNNNLTVTINNKQSKTLENVIIEIYSNESDKLIATYTIDSLAPGTSSIVVNDPTIRKLTESTVWPVAMNNKIAYNVVVKYGDVEIFNKSFDKIVAYDGYFNKTYAYNGAPNKINRNYTITGDIIVASQPTDVYADQFSRQRNETWDISVPDDSTLVKAFLYFNYNWDTSYFPDGWTLTFNGNTITDKYIFWDTDKGNLGYWGNYIYGTLVFDVTEYFNNGENIFDITKTGNCALYPSTLVVLYNTTGSKTIKDVYFTDICDVLYGYYNTEYTNLTNVYVPYNGINTTNLADASWYVFAGSADGSNDGNISFNGKVFDNLWSEGSSNSCYAYIANVTDVIGENNNAWYLTNPKLMTTVVVYEQILVVTRNLELPTAETTVKSEYTSVPTVYAGVNNTITVTVKNTGASAKDVVVTLKIGDGVIGTQTLADYEAGETYTLTFVDTTIRPVTENTVNGNNNEYMNYTVVVEDIDGVLINETNSSFVILYNGNLGKDYEYPNANPLLREYNITGDVIVANGSQYAGSSDNVNDVITVAFGGDVAEALLYISYNWNNPSLGDFTSWNITFNNKVIAPIASYNDQGNLGNYGKYAYGLVVYNVTGLVVNGENALSINRTPKNVAIYPASLLVLTNDESSLVQKTIYILEEVDLLSKTNNKNLPTGFNTTFNVIDGNATLYVFAAGAQAGEGNLIVNDETYTDVWKGTDKSVEVFTTDVDAGNIKVYFESTGGTILALHQIVVVENPITPKKNLTISATADPIAVGDDAVIVVFGFEDASGNVTAKVGGGVYTMPIFDGTATFTISGLIENATAVITYPGDDKYYNASTTVDIVVNSKAKENATISIDAPSEATEGDNVTVTVTLPEDATGTVTIGNSVVPVVNGIASAVLTNIPAGNITVPITYSGDDKYNSIETNVTINVNEKPVPHKENLTLEATANPIAVGDDAVIVVIGFEDASGNVTAKVGSGVYTTPIVDGTATFTISGLIENATAVITYPGDDKYYNAITTVDIVVNSKAKENATISIDAPSEATEGDNVTVTVTLPEDATGTVTIGNSVVPVVNGIASAVLTNIPAGNITVPITYSGDDKFNPIETSVNVGVNPQPVPSKKDLNISVSANPITAGEDVVIVVSDLADATGTVTAAVNGKTYTVPINGGKAAITVPGLTENATAVVSYPGDDKYNNFTESVNIVVNPKEKENATITIDVPLVTEGQNATVNVELPKDATGNVTATAGGKTYTAPVKDGKATITIPELAAGNYTVPVTYSGDDKYNPLSEEINIAVDEDKSDIIKAPDVTKYFKGPERFVVTVTDYQGKPLANKSVTILINGVPYGRKTNTNGTTSIPLGLNSGVYNVTVTVDNNTIYSVATILSTVNGSDVVKMYRNGTQYYATFLDSTGKYLAEGTMVKFNINGVMYERKISGDKGLAKLNINLEHGQYIITATNPVTGENTANNITILSLLTENKDLIKYYRNASQYTVKVLGADGKAVGGVSVKFNINGVFYERTTNASGIAKLNINLQAGDYIITSEYGGCSVSNNIKVLSVLTANDISMRYRDGTQFKVKLVDGQGKPYANQTVKFNLNGVFYERVTNASGIAKLNINLHAGDYIITSEYNGCKVSNNIKILPVLSASDISMRYRDGTQFKANLVDGQGKPYANQVITFNINGVFYNRMTDSSGQAKLNINLMPGQYIITSSYNGSNIANTIRISA